MEVETISPDKFGSDSVDPSKIGPSEGSSVDLEKYHKKETTVERVELAQVKSTFTAKKRDALGQELEEHHPQWVLKIQSKVLETIGEGDDKIEFRASELFNLTQNDRGVLTGFPTGEKSNLMLFMKDLKIKEPEKMSSLKEVMDSLMGKTVTIKYYEKERDGKKKGFLTFMY